jgi:SAM-dependent methyltransferase
MENEMNGELPYQSHEKNTPAMSDSFAKLNRIRLPNDLQNKKVLDIGCNEGFFCNQAIMRGAAEVVGIDANKKAIENAKRIYHDERIRFIHQDWSELPPGKYDLVLWLSAMHYELDPLRVLVQIADRLTEDGLFILEGGVISRQVNEMISCQVKEMVRVIRHDGALWYPTFDYLEDCFKRSGMSYRIIGGGVLVGSDPVPRYVFHCHKLKTNVMLIIGKPFAGKSSLANQLKDVVTKLISLDYFIANIYHAKYTHTDFEDFVKRNTNPDALVSIYEKIDENGFTETYIELLAKSIAQSDALVVVEGYMTDTQVDMFVRRMSGRARVWLMRRA